MSNSTRRRRAPRLRAASMCCGSIDAIAPASSSVTNGACFQTKAITMPRQSSRLCAGERLDQAAADQHVVEHAVLGEERAHELPGHDERDEQRPAVEPAQDRHGARDSRRASGSPRWRSPRRRSATVDSSDDADREDQVGAIELARLGEVLEREAAVLRPEGEHGRQHQRNDEEHRDDRERGTARARRYAPRGQRGRRRSSADARPLAHRTGAGGGAVGRARYFSTTRS